MPKTTIDFDSNAPIRGNEYDETIKKALPGYEAMHTMVSACLKSRSNSYGVSNVLVIGAGTGFELIHFALKNPEWEILGVDPSANMLAIAQQKIESEQLSSRVKLFTGYTQDLPATPIYNIATAILVMHFLADDGSKLAFLENIAQRLQPSASFVLVDAFGEKGSFESEQTIAFVQSYWQETGLPSQKAEELLHAFASVYPVSEMRVIELLQQAGFRNIIRFYTGLWIGGWIATKN